MDPRLTPDNIKSFDALLRGIMKAVKATVGLFLPREYKIILILADDESDLPGMIVLSEVDDRADMERHLKGALQRVTNPTEDLIDTSDDQGVKH